MILDVCLAAAGLLLSGGAGMAEQGSEETRLVREIRPDPGLTALFAPQAEGFLGADCASTVALPGGRVLWLFADTVVGKLNEDGERRGQMIHNSAAIQEIKDGTPASPVFYWPSKDGKAQSLIRQDDADVEYFWPGCGIYTGGKLLMSYFRVRTSGEGAMGFNVLGTDLVVVDNPLDAPDKWKYRIQPLKFAGGGATFSAAAMEDKGYLYLLGCRPDGTGGFPGSEALLARAKISDLLAGKVDEAFEFLTGERTWSRDVGEAGAVFKPGAAEGSLHWDEHLQRYISVVMPAFTNHLYISVAEKLEGPWTPSESHKVPGIPEQEGLFSYAGRAHPELPHEPGEMVLTYVTNATSLWTMMATPAIYVPVFLRARLVLEPGTQP